MSQKVEEAIGDDPVRSPQPTQSRSTKWRRVHDSKKKGKWTRSNERIGSFPIKDATDLAVELTGDSNIDLRLPEWSEVCEDWKKFDWLASSDVVYRRVLCLLCQKNVLQPAFVHHMKTEHPDEDSTVHEILRRMTEVRLSRFYTRSVVYDSDLIGLFPEVELSVLREFLGQCGCVVTKSPEDCSNMKDKRSRPVKLPSYPVDFSSLRKEHMIKGVPINDAEDMAKVLSEEGGVLAEVLFSESFPCYATGEAQMVVPYKRVFCHSCRVAVPEHLLRVHLSKSVYHTMHGRSTEDIGPLLRRLTEVRLWHYFSSNPVPLWKVQEVAGGEPDLTDRLSTFLKDCGFAINMMEELSRSNDPWPVYVPESNTNMFGSPRANVCYSPSPSDLPSCSEYSSDTESMSSDTSSTHSTSSTYSTGDRMDIPYSVLDAIMHDHRVEHAILDIETMLEMDENQMLDQTQYMFIMGWAMYCLVVSNGCKLNVLSKLTVSDWTNATSLNDPCIRRVLRFSTNSTATSSRLVNWVVADEVSCRALQLYSIVRQRRVLHMNATEMCSHGLSAFFISFNLKSLNGKDVDYPLTQFLRMCNVPWSFRAREFAASVGSLVVRDNKKHSADYALEFYRCLRDRSKGQAQIIGPTELHPFIADIDVVVAPKVRKDKGTVKVPLGPNASTMEKMLRTKRGLIPERDRLAKRLKRLHDEDDRLLQMGSGESGRETPSVHPRGSKESTPEATSPSRAYASTPSPDRYGEGYNTGEMTYNELDDLAFL